MHTQVSLMAAMVGDTEVEKERRPGNPSLPVQVGRPSCAE